MKSWSRGGRSAVLAAAVGSIVLFGGCASDPPPAEAKTDFFSPTDPPYLERTDPPDMRPAFLDRTTALQALTQSEEYFKKPSSKKGFPYTYTTDGGAVSHERQVKTLATLRRIIEVSSSADEFQGWCAQSFDWYRSIGAERKGQVLYTAYCEPIFDGRRTAEGDFVWPLYTLPADLVKDEEGNCIGRKGTNGEMVASTYYTREEIETGNLLRGKELVFLRDPFEVYIAHVQGSARINLPDGTQMCVGYAGKNGHEYESIGQALVKENKIPKEKLNLQTLKRYFKENPSELARVLAINKSYVFFLDREPGPFGCLGAKVTPWHSLATDKAIFPRGGPCVAVTRLPVASPTAADGVEFRPATILAFDQDRGGAIKAAGRADVFIGTGPEAERLAGHTMEVGQLYYFFVKDGVVIP